MIIGKILWNPIDKDYTNRRSSPSYEKNLERSGKATLEAHKSKWSHFKIYWRSREYIQLTKKCGQPGNWENITLIYSIIWIELWATIPYLKHVLRIKLSHVSKESVYNWEILWDNFSAYLRGCLLWGYQWRKELVVWIVLA